MNDIYVVPDEAVINIEELNAMGFTYPKRKCVDENASRPAKKSPFDD